MNSVAVKSSAASQTRSPVITRLDAYKQRFSQKQTQLLKSKETANATQSKHIDELRGRKVEEQNKYVMRMQETLRSRDETIAKYNRLVGSAKTLAQTIEKRNTQITALQNKIKEISKDGDQSFGIIKFLESQIEALQLTEEERQAAAYSNEIRYMEHEAQKYREGTQAHEDHQGLKIEEEFTIRPDLLQTPVPVKTPAKHNYAERQGIDFVEAEGDESSSQSFNEFREVLGKSFLKEISHNSDDNKFYSNVDGVNKEISEEAVLKLLGEDEYVRSTVDIVYEIKEKTGITTEDITADHKTIDFVKELIGRVEKMKNFESVQDLNKDITADSDVNSALTLIQVKVNELAPKLEKKLTEVFGAISPKAEELEGEVLVVDELEAALLGNSKGAAEEPTESSSVKSTADSYEEYNDKTLKEKVDVLLDTIIKPRLEELYRAEHPEEISEYEFSVLNEIFDIIEDKELDTLGGFQEILKDLKIKLAIKGKKLTINGTKTNVTQENYTFSSACEALNEYKSELNFEPYTTDESFKYDQHKRK